jgi:hypothetical protein
MGWQGDNLKETSVVAMMWNVAMQLKMDSLTRYWLAGCGVGVGVGGCGVGGCAGGEAIGGSSGTEDIGCCRGRFIIGFIDAADFVVVGLFLWRFRSISRRSRKSPRFPYILNLLFRCRLDRRERDVVWSDFWVRCMFVAFVICVSSQFSSL